MTNDAEARKAVRKLLQRFDQINERRLGMAHVLAEKDAHEYRRLREVVDVAIQEVIRPNIAADVERQQAYAALDDPKADWPAAVLAMLNRGPLETNWREK